MALPGAEDAQPRESFRLPGFDAFPDRAAVPDWAVYELAWAVEEGLINGSTVGGKTYLKPLNEATRAQFVAILQRFLQ